MNVIIPGQVGASGHWQVPHMGVLKWVVLQLYSAAISEEVLEQATVGSLPPLKGGSGMDAPAWKHNLYIIVGKKNQPT